MEMKGYKGKGAAEEGCLVRKAVSEIAIVRQQCGKLRTLSL
jgi:hypothetical protein